MRFEHRFTVRASQEAVARFHASAQVLRAITPPPAILRIRHAPEPLGEGDHVIFTMWLGPIPIRWDSLIHDVSVAGFADKQVEGVFGSWVHRHHFVKVDGSTTEVYDVVEATLKQHILHWPLGLLLWLSNPLLFRYRARCTKRLLETPA